MSNGKIIVNRNGNGQFTCLKEDYGRIQLQLKPGVVPEQNELDLMGQFLNQCAMKKYDGLVVERTNLTERRVPVLLCYPEKVFRAPVVFFQHGFDARKESDLHFGMEFAKEGYFVILPDARRHGERKAVDFQAVQRDFQIEFLRIVKETAEDIIGILDSLAEDNRVDSSRAGVVGVSMGGFIAFLAAIMDSRFKAAAPIIGSPDWHSPIGPPQVHIQGSPDLEMKQFIDDWEPLSHPERFLPKAWLIQNAIEDPNVPIQGSRQLFRKLQGYYSDHPEKLEMLEYPGIGHEVTDEMIQKTVKWFTAFLAFGPGK